MGVGDDHLAEYIDETFQALLIYKGGAQVINNGLIAYDHYISDSGQPSAKILKDGFCYPVFQLLKKINGFKYEFGSGDRIAISDVSRNNQIFVGKIMQSHKHTLCCKNTIQLF